VLQSRTFRGGRRRALDGRWQVSCKSRHMLRLAAAGFIGLLILPACSSSDTAGSVPSGATKSSAGGVPDGGGDGSAQSVLPRPIPHGGSPTVEPWRYESVALTYNWVAATVDCTNAPAWPLPPPPAAAQNFATVCGMVDRQGASTLVPGPSHDDRMLAMSSGCLAYEFRPLLPGEVGCTPGAAPFNSGASFSGCTP
jgi:hypothetical protein